MVEDLKRVGGFDLLSEPARERLRRRLIEAGGNIDVVADQLRTRLEAYDTRSPDAAAANPAERPFLVAQLAYLDALATAQTGGNEPQQKQGVFSRLRGALRGQ